MKKFAELVHRLAEDEGGATMVEYTILIGLITVVAISLIAAVGSWVQAAWSNVNSTLAAATVAS